MMPLNDKQQAQFTLVCARIADGMSLRDACEHDDVPHRETIRAWLAEDAAALSVQYARARDEQADHYADEIVAIADGDDDPAKVRNRVDARKWIACKLKPKRYGDKLALGGADDLPAIRQEVQERADAFTERLAGMAARAKEDKGETRH